MPADPRSRSSRSVPLLKAGLIWPRLDHVPAVPVPMPARSGSSVWPTWRGDSPDLAGNLLHRSA